MFGWGFFVACAPKCDLGERKTEGVEVRGGASFLYSCRGGGFGCVPGLGGSATEKLGKSHLKNNRQRVAWDKFHIRKVSEMGPQLMTKLFPNIYKLCPGIYAAEAFPDSVTRSRSVNKSGGNYIRMDFTAQN
jgi:hypothetical protein